MAPKTISSPANEPGSSPAMASTAGRMNVKPPKCPLKMRTMPTSPATTVPERRTPPSDRRPPVAGGVTCGSVMAWAASAIPAMPAPRTKVPRQPQSSPSQAPRGTATTVPRATPELMTVSARPRWLSCTNCAATAVAMAQKPPSAAPSRRRASMTVAKLGAIATRRFDTTASRVRPIITHRRSARGSTTERNRAEATAAKAVALTACPAAPVDTFRPSAISGSRLAGRNSAMMNAKMPRLREPTPAQDARPPAVEASFDAM